MTNAFGRITMRHGHGPHSERADKLFGRLKGAHLDGSYEDEMSHSHQRGLQAIDDLDRRQLGPSANAAVDD